jgi:hypothetical protein
MHIATPGRMQPPAIVRLSHSKYNSRYGLGIQKFLHGTHPIMKKYPESSFAPKSRKNSRAGVDLPL